MNQKAKLLLWCLLGIGVCLLLIPTITDAGGVQTYISFAAFLLIFFGGIVGIVLLTWIYNRIKRRPEYHPLPKFIAASQIMTTFMILFGIYWYDFSEARPGAFWGTASYNYTPPIKNEDGWDTASIDQNALDKDLISQIIERFISDKNYKWQHSFLLAHNNKLVVEEYFYDHNQQSLHDLRSANKSITSILLGAAIQQGFIKNEHDPISHYLPEYEDIFIANPEKQAITLHHLLTMQSGLDANDWVRESPGNENRIYRQKGDWIRTFLELNLTAKPGAEFRYATLGEMTLRQVIANVSKMPLDAFSKQYLFDPLGIKAYQWTHRLPTRSDVPYRIELTARDFAKLGQLYLNNGVWEGKQIVPENWVSLSTSRHTKTTERRLGFPDYGYLWWRHDFPVGNTVIEGFQAQGNGGQFLFVFPELDTVAVFTSKNFGRRRQINPLLIMKEEIVPAMITTPISQ